MDLEQAVLEQAEAAKKRQRELKRYIVLTWLYMLIISAVFSFAILNISNSNEELSEVINRRSPVLDYLRCHDKLEDTKSSAQTRFVFAYIEYKENPSESTYLNYLKLQEEYRNADKKLLELDSCPEFPN